SDQPVSLGESIDERAEPDSLNDSFDQNPAARSAARLRNGDGRAHVTPFGLGSASRPWQSERTVTRLSLEVNRRRAPASINRSKGTPARAPSRWLSETSTVRRKAPGLLDRVDFRLPHCLSVAHLRASAHDSSLQADCRGKSASWISSKLGSATAPKSRC